MKQTAWLLVAVLASAASLYAQDASKATTMTGVLCNSKCVTQTAGQAACDPKCTDKSGDIVLVDNHGHVFNIANQDKAMRLVGKKVKMKCRSVKDKKDTMYIDTISLYGGGG